jgi:hypothetical protein
MVSILRNSFFDFFVQEGSYFHSPYQLARCPSENPHYSCYPVIGGCSPTRVNWMLNINPDSLKSLFVKLSTRQDFYFMSGCLEPYSTIDPDQLDMDLFKSNLWIKSKHEPPSIDRLSSQNAAAFNGQLSENIHAECSSGYILTVDNLSLIFKNTAHLWLKTAFTFLNQFFCKPVRQGHYVFAFKVIASFETA